MILQDKCYPLISNLNNMYYLAKYWFSRSFTMYTTETQNTEHKEGKLPFIREQIT